MHPEQIRELLNIGIGIELSTSWNDAKELGLNACYIATTLARIVYDYQNTGYTPNEIERLKKELEEFHIERQKWVAVESLVEKIVELELEIEQLKK